MKHFSLAENIMSRMKEVEEELGVKSEILTLSVNDIDNWTYKNTLHINTKEFQILKANIESHGQLQPIMVLARSKDFQSQTHPQTSYVILDGFHRWLIAKQLQKPIFAIQKELPIKQAVNYLLYNSMRSSCSDYSKGMLYYALLKNGVMSPQQLSKSVNITLTKLNHLLSFSSVPQCIWDAVGDMSHVSAKTASVIKSLSEKDEDHYQALISLSQKIGSGYAEKRLRHAVNEQLGLCEQTIVEQSHMHYFKHHGDVLMRLKDNIITLDENVVSDESFDSLVDMFETAIKSWQDAHEKK